MTYEHIKAQRNINNSVEKMCRVLGVSTSGYYDWMDRKPSKREEENEDILKIMKESYDRCEGIIGLDKLLEDVNEKFPSCARNRVYRLQRKHELYSVRKKPFRVCITDSNHYLPKAPNLLDQNFTVDAPHKVWVTDITQIVIPEGKAYLATVKDIFHKEIVGWSLARHMRTELCLEALDNAVMKHRPPKELIHHSDQGSQYCSKEYVERLKKYGMKRSMSRRGNCWDNAPAETFFSTIKSERIYHMKYKSFDEMKKDIFWYIEWFYNRNRRHSAIGQVTPEKYLNQYYENLKQAA